MNASKPKLLDLFCGAGGAAVGYHRAGFEVTGVDNRPQPRYPYEFHQADAMTYPLDGFDVIHASPPCQDHSVLSSRTPDHGTGWMLAATRARLQKQSAVWIIENVPGAPMRADFYLCGAMFGLRTYRHRLFELDERVTTLLATPPHSRHRIKTSTKNRASDLSTGLNISVTGDPGSSIGPLCMGIDWMTGNELSQAIPPAYTQFIGAQLADIVRDKNA